MARVSVDLATFVLVAFGGQVAFDANNGFNAGGGGCLDELNDTVHGAMIGDGQGVHAEFFGAFDEGADTA